jgi:hypothetical protein
VREGWEHLYKSLGKDVLKKEMANGNMEVDFNKTLERIG